VKQAIKNDSRYLGEFINLSNQPMALEGPSNPILTMELVSGRKAKDIGFMFIGKDKKYQIEVSSLFRNGKYKTIISYMYWPLI